MAGSKRPRRAKAAKSSSSTPSTTTAAPEQGTVSAVLATAAAAASSYSTTEQPDDSLDNASRCDWFQEFLTFVPTPSSRAAWHEILEGKASVLTAVAATTASASAAAASPSSPSSSPASAVTAATYITAAAAAALSSSSSFPVITASSTSLGDHPSAAYPSAAYSPSSKSTKSKEKPPPEQLSEEARWGYKLFLWTHCLQRLVLETTTTTNTSSTSSTTTSSRHQQHASASSSLLPSASQNLNPHSQHHQHVLLTRLAYKLACFVTKQHPTNHKIPSQASRPLVGRTVLIATIAALKGMELASALFAKESAALQDDDDDSSNGNEEEDTNKNTKKKKNLAFSHYLQSMVAGTLALEAIVTWQQTATATPTASTNTTTTTTFGTSSNLSTATTVAAANMLSSSSARAATPTCSLITTMAAAATADTTGGGAGTVAVSYQEYWAELSKSLDAWLQNHQANKTFVAEAAASAARFLDWTHEVAFWKVLHGQEPPAAAQSQTTSTATAATTKTAAKVSVPSPPPPAKRARGSRSKKATATVTAAALLSSSSSPPIAAAAASRSSNEQKQQASSSVQPLTLPMALHRLVQSCEANSVTMDGSRLAPRRWSSVALVWFLQGQASILNLAQGILDHSNNNNNTSTDYFTEGLGGGTDDEDEDRFHTKKSRKNDEQQKHQQRVPAVVIALPPIGPLRVALASRLMRVLYEISLCSGSRQPPTGGVEAYVKLFGIAVKAKKKAPAAAAAADLRSQATVALYKLVTLHAETVEELIHQQQEATTSTGSSDKTSSSRGSMFSGCYAFVAQAVQDIARSSAVGDGDNDRMECAAAAYGLQARCWGDARFTTFCVQKLAQSIKIHGGDSVLGGTSSSDPYRMTPLPPPVASSSSHKNKAAAGSSFAGLYNEGTTTLTVFLRAMHPDYYEGLLSLLIDIAGSCYGVKQQPKTKSRRKKRKKEEEVVRRIDPIQMTLATEVFQALELCVQQQQQQLSSFTIRSQLRAHLTTDHMSRLIDLGTGALEFLKRARGPSSSNNVGSKGVVEFTREEKLLWDAYTNVCLSLGRGQTNYKIEKSVVLGASRFQVYKKVVEHAQRQQDSTGSWPLWLCAPHRRLLAASLAGEAFPDTHADHFIVGGFISAISEAFSDLNKFICPLPVDPLCVTLEEGIPLSLNHARLFCLALVRLSEHDRVSSLSSLITAVHAGLNSGSPPPTASFAAHEACANFFARVVAMCTSLAVTVTCSHTLSSKLYGIVGNSQPSYSSRASWDRIERSFTSVFDDSTSSELEEPDFHVSSMDAELSDRLQSILEGAFALGFESAPVDRCYLLFTAWSALGKSDLWRSNGTTAVAPYIALPRETKDLSRLVLELRDEICYVNRLIHQINRQTYDSSFLRVIDQKLHGSSVMARKTLTEKVKKELKAMVTKASSICNDLVLRFVPSDEDQPEEVPAQAYCLFEALPSYLTFAVSCHTKADRSFFSHIRMSLNDNQSRKRNRSYSSDSDNYPSEDESTDSRDIVFEAANRLQSVCSTCGAVPSHPDWLDLDCRLWEGVSAQEATDVALRSLEILNKIACVGSDQANRFQTRAIRQPSENVKLAADLVRIHFLGAAFAEADATRPIGLPVSTITGIDSRVIDICVGDGVDERRSYVHRHWLRDSAQRCLGTLQDVIGNQLVSDMDSPDLRGGCEWEVLYAGALSSCALSSSLDLQEAAIDGFDSELNAGAERWYYVFKSALNALVPATALLRFSACGMGRKPHPLKSTEASLEDFDSMDLAETLTGKVAPESSIAVVSKTLSVVSQAVSDRDICCEAVALNLVTDRWAFPLLRGVGATKFAFATLCNLLQSSAAVAVRDHVSALITLFEVVAVLLNCGSPSQSGVIGSGKCLRAAVGSEDQMISTIATADLSLFETLAAWSPAHGPVHASQDRFIASLVSSIWPDFSFVNVETRMCFLQTLCSLVSLDSDFGNSSVVHLSNAFNSYSEDRLRLLIEHDLCHVTTSEQQGMSFGSVDATARSLLASLLACVLVVQGSSAFSRPELVLNILNQHLPSWIRLDRDSRVLVLNLYLLYSCRCCQLHSAGTKLLEDDAADESVKLENLATFAAFLWEFQETRPSLPLESDTSRCHALADSSSPLINLCTHARQTGFLDQHWYHCLTCGLTGDKGCCTLCALICHKDHDVCYSRYSAFFCDCGAEGGTADSSRRFVCKCGTSLPQQTVDEAYALGRGESLTVHSKIQSPELDRTEAKKCGTLSLSQYAKIAKSAFGGNVTESLALLSELGRKDDWPRQLFLSVKDQFVASKESLPPVPAAMSREVSSYGMLRRAISRRTPSVPLTQAGDEGVLRSAVSFRSGSFQVKISTDSSVDTLKRAMLSTSGACRSAIAADSRARVIIAESNSLLFCTFMPVLSHVFSDPPPARDSIYQRASATLLGVKALDFNVVGIRLCQANEDRLVVWGTHEACVGVLSDGRNGLDRIVDLEVGLGSLESGSGVILDCGWLPGCVSCLYICCLRSILLFDFHGCANSMAPSSAIKVGADAAIRGLVVTELDVGAGMAWKGHILMEDGHLHSFELERDDKGAFKVLNLNLDPKHSIKLPVNGGSSDTTPAFSLTLGEGINLSYLSQSKVLLYQAVGESVLALQLDDKCSIANSFTLLPKSISKEVLPLQTEGTFVTGPFTYWTELGAVSHGTSVYFRVCCIGRRHSKDPVPLCIDFNDSESRVKELSWPSSGYSFSVSPSVEGMSAFSCPFAFNRDPSGSSTNPGFTERVFLATLFSNGSLQLFGEEVGALAVSRETRALRLATRPVIASKIPFEIKKDMPLLSFEGLTNIMEADDVIFQGIGIGSSDEIRKKLLRDNDNFLVGPGLEGFSFTVRPKPRTVQQERTHVLVAFKFLVGTTSSSSIPRKLSIQGRDLELLPSAKKWYCFFLTQQEVALVLRAGFVSIRVSETFDCCSNPIIDAVETFACDRSSVSLWLPSSLISVVPSASFEDLRETETKANAPRHKKALFLSLETFDRVCKVLRPLNPFEPLDSDLLRQIVHDTALDQHPVIAESVDSILESFGWDEDSRESFRDKAVLHGCTSFLTKCQEMLSVDSAAPEKQETTWQLLQLPLRSCFRAAIKVASCRPLNYVQSVEDMSPGVRASKFVVDCMQKTNTNLDLIHDLVELCLVGVAAGTYSGTDGGNFEGLRLMLACENEIVVALACASVASFCEKNQAPPPRSPEGEFDLFASQKMVVYYRCDGCGLLPIKETRFSFLDDRRPVDLCESCYRAAHGYASLKGFSETHNVLVKDKLVGSEVKLTCSEIKLMQAVVIPQSADANEETVQRQQLFDNFMEGLFSQVVELLVGSNFSDHSLVTLALAIVHYSGTGVERAKRLAYELTRSLSRALTTVGPVREQSTSSMVAVLRALTKIVVWDDGAARCLSGSDKGGEAPKTPSSDVPKCSTHGVASSRRLVTIGPHKGRVYYCCGKDFKSQCKFFRWEEGPESDRPHFNEVLSKIVWDDLHPILERLCDYVSTHFKPCPSDKSTADALTGVQLDVAAGAMCSRHRLRDVLAKELLLLHNIRSSLLPGDAKCEDIIDATLTLVALISCPKGNATAIWSPILCQIISSKDNSDNDTSSQRAKRALLQLCGSKGRYVTIRAHFAFAMNRERLAKELGDLVYTGLLVKEKARQCGPLWKQQRRDNLAELKAGVLLGTEDLISEDILTSRRLEEARRILAELASVAKKRPDHWVRFCGLSSAPEFRAATVSVTEQLLKSPPVVLLFSVACLLRGESQAKAFRLIDLALSPPTPKEDVEMAGPGSSTSFLDSFRCPAQVLELSVAEACAFVVRFGCNGISGDIRQLACSIISKICSELDPSVAGELFERLIGAALSKTHSLGKCNIEVLGLLQDLLSRAGSLHIDVNMAASRIQSYWKQQMLAIRYDRSNQAYVYFETRSTAPSQKKRYELSPCTHCMQLAGGRREKKSNSAHSGDAANPSGTRESSTSRSGTATTKGWLPEQVTVLSRGRLEGWRESSVSDEFNSYSSFKYRLVLSDVHLEVTDPRGRYAKTISIYYSPRPVTDVAHLKSPDYEDKWQTCGTITLVKGASRGSCKLEKPVVAANIRIEYSSFYERPGSSKATDGSFIVHCPRCTRVVNNAHGVCGNCGEVCFQCRKCRHINYDRLDAFLCVECGYCASGSFVYELTAAIASNAIAIQNDLDFERSCRMLSVATRLYEDLRSTLRDKLAEIFNKNTGAEESTSSTNSTGGGDGVAAALRRAFEGALPQYPGETEGESPITLAKLGKQGSVVKAVARSDSQVSTTSRSQSLMRLTREWRESAITEARRPGDVVIHHLGRDMDDDDPHELFGLLEGSGRSGDDPLSRLLASMQNRRERRTVTAAASSDDQPHNSSRREDGGPTTRSTSAAAATSTSASGGGGGGGAATTQGLVTKESLDMCDRLYSLMREAEREAYHLRARVFAWRRLESDSLTNYYEDQSNSHHSHNHESTSAADTSSSSTTIGVATSGSSSSSSRIRFEPSHCSVCSSPVALQLLKLWLALLKIQPDKVAVSKDMVQLLCSDDLPIVYKGLLETKRQAVKEIALHCKSNGGSELVLEALALRLQVTQSVSCAEILGSIIEDGGSEAFIELATQVLQASTEADRV